MRRWKPISRWQLVIPDDVRTLLQLLACDLLVIIAFMSFVFFAESAVAAIVVGLILSIFACALKWLLHCMGTTQGLYSKLWRTLKRMVKEDVISNATEGAISIV